MCQEGIGKSRSRPHCPSECLMSTLLLGRMSNCSVLAWLWLKLWVQEGTTQSALTKACPPPVAESFLHVGDVVVRRQDTSRTCVSLVEPLVGDMRVAQVFDFRHLLPRNCQTTVKAALGAAVHGAGSCEGLKKISDHRCHHLEKPNWDVRILTLSGS